MNSWGRPELTVVTPAYNEETRLPATLRAVTGYLDRQVADWQVLVVDDGSTDGFAGSTGDCRCCDQSWLWDVRQPS